MNHPFSLAGKTVLVVGSATPTGERAAATCARMGASVIAQDAFAPMNVPLDGLLYCTACAHPPQPLAQITEDAIEQTIASRLMAPALAVRKALQNGMLREGASIVLEKMRLTHATPNGGGSFLSVEGGLDSLAASLALECAPRRMRVNTITTRAFADAAHADDFAHAAVYLLSPASRWVTGSDLILTGHATL